jgi:hypothetical protein
MTDGGTFRPGTHIWLCGKDGSDEPFLPGQVESVQGGTLKIKMSDGREQTVDPQKAEVLVRAPHMSSTS